MSEENMENVEQSNNKTEQANETFKNAVKKMYSQNTNLMKIIFIFIAVFLGTFLAIYLVIDNLTNKLGFAPLITTFEQVEKMFDENEKFIERNSPAPVKIEEKSDKYIVTVDLKAFDNKKDNVNVEFKNNGIEIDGKYLKKDGSQTSEKSFYQKVIFPKEIKEDKVSQKEKGDKYIISLPFED